jgi:hypothetical protein
MLQLTTRLICVIDAGFGHIVYKFKKEGKVKPKLHTYTQIHR